MEYEVPDDEAAQMQAEIQRLFAEIERANERMKRDQEEIVRSKTRTRAMLAELAMLNTNYSGARRACSSADKAASGTA